MKKRKRKGMQKLLTSWKRHGLNPNEVWTLTLQPYQFDYVNALLQPVKNGEMP
jgi:hypothetical protein